MTLIERARAFAQERHAGQIRKGLAEEPYEVHLREVADLMAGWGGSEDWIAAAWLHDTVEDCPPTSQSELTELFGAIVAGLVMEVTDDKSLPKAERKRQQVKHAAGKSPGAALIKIADKTSNVRALRLSPPASWSVEWKNAYLDWAEEVIGALPAGHDGPKAVFEAELAASRAMVCDVA
jgi:(p)ppGpp synthase/HD superfamily hydrolase